VSDDLAPALSQEINDERLGRTLVDLIGLPSQNPFEEAVGKEQGEGLIASYLAERLGALGWECDLHEFAPGRSNLVARRDGAGRDRRPTLMFAGHADTVETTGYVAPFAGRQEGDRIYGRGACDMKAALACYVEMAEVIAAAEVPVDADLMIAAVADEEYRQRGAKELHRRGIKADGVVIGEPTQMRLCLATKGLMAVDLAVQGHATHSSVPQHGGNAILAAASLLAGLPAYQRELDNRAHPLLGPATVNVGVIDGGVKPNIVPSECRAQISRRLLPGETATEARAELARALASQLLPPGELSWSVSDAWWTVEPYELPDRHPLGVLMTDAGSGLVDTTPTGFPASSDAAYFGAPVVLLGPGSLAQAHSLDEWVSRSEMRTATEIYLRAALGAGALIVTP
jgi:succinyl-diaminopimelate desuccinylase